MSEINATAKSAPHVSKPFVFATLLIALAAFTTTALAAEKPGVGDSAKDFELMGLDGKKVMLSEQVKMGPVVLVVLRGYPGYQCPLCTRQVGELISKSADFKKAGARVLMVYPGPSEKLKEHAMEFVNGKEFPENFSVLMDPDYKFTNSYNLRWKGAGETAYPSTFVIDSKNMIQYAKVSMTHGDRAPVADVLKALGK
jgi:peroxiredoxin Q/BCP